MSFINLSTALNETLMNHSQFNIENAISIPILNLTRNSSYNNRISSIEALLNEINLALNESQFNIRHATSTLPLNRKTNTVFKSKAKDMFTDPKYENIPRSKRNSKRNSKYKDPMHTRIFSSFIALRG